MRTYHDVIVVVYLPGQIKLNLSFICERYERNSSVTRAYGQQVNDLFDEVLQQSPVVTPVHVIVVIGWIFGTDRARGIDSERQVHLSIRLFTVIQVRG